MYSGFGLYISAVGIALVFASLLAIGLLVEVTKRLFREGEEPTEKEGRLAKVAAVAAVLSLTEGERIYPVSKAEGTGHWRAAAKIEALDRGMKQER
jgi:Na+-transporting methylmalonyl-CoA/oxaloacetate decarboxylase gamma subunit